MTTDSKLDTSNTINLVVAALGGQGGGVLVEWIAAVARSHGWPCQATSVPGVAQRTGATIYYLEIFPAPLAELDSAPVMSLFPTPGDVDIVIASEIVEAGRMVQRGFVTPDRTTLVASSHRIYAINERADLEHVPADADKLRDVALDRSRSLVMFDMEQIAVEHGTIISASLLGAVAGSNALPFDKQAYVEIIRAGGMQVEANLAAFTASYERASNSSSIVEIFEPTVTEPKRFQLPTPTTTRGEILLDRIRRLPEPLQETAYYGTRKLTDYLDHAYADAYLDQVEKIAEKDSPQRQYALTLEFARQLALWSSFEDIVRVAHLKVKRSRQQKLRREVGATDEQIVEVRDFFRPRVEEICGLMPNAIGKRLVQSPAARRMIGWFTSGKQLATTHVGVFLLMRTLASLRRFRRRTYAHVTETARVNLWLEALHANIADYDKALEIAKMATLIKGYGASRERGQRHLNSVFGLCKSLTAEALRELRQAALGDDESRFSRALADFEVG